MCAKVKFIPHKEGVTEPSYKLITTNIELLLRAGSHQSYLTHLINANIMNSNGSQSHVLLH